MFINVTLIFAWMIVFAQGIMILGCLWVFARLRQRHDVSYQPLLTEDGPPLYGFPEEFSFINPKTNTEISIWDYVKEKSTMILFIKHDCGFCEDLLGVAGKFKREWVKDVNVLIVAQINEDEIKRLATAHPELDFIPDGNGSITFNNNIHRWPYAILLDKMGVTMNKGVVNSTKHLEGLVMGRRGKPIEDVLSVSMERETV